jgi:hypothetical protein
VSGDTFARRAAFVALLGLTAVSALPRDVAAAGQREHWVATWATSPQLTEEANLPPAPGLGDATLRQVVHVSLGGKTLRGARRPLPSRAR